MWHVPPRSDPSSMKRMHADNPPSDTTAASLAIQPVLRGGSLGAMFTPLLSRTIGARATSCRSPSHARRKTLLELVDVQVDPVRVPVAEVRGTAAGRGRDRILGDGEHGAPHQAVVVRDLQGHGWEPIQLLRLHVVPKIHE